MELDSEDKTPLGRKMKKERYDARLAKASMATPIPTPATRSREVPKVDLRTPSPPRSAPASFTSVSPPAGTDSPMTGNSRACNIQDTGTRASKYAYEVTAPLPTAPRAKEQIGEVTKKTKETRMIPRKTRAKASDSFTPPPLPSSTLSSLTLPTPTNVKVKKGDATQKAPAAAASALDTKEEKGKGKAMELDTQAASTRDAVHPSRTVLIEVPPALPHDVPHRLPTSYAKAAALPTPANLKADKGKRKATESKPTQTTSAASPPSYIHPSRVPLVNAFSASSSVTHTPSGQAVTIPAAMCTTHLIITGCNAPPGGSQWKQGFIEAWNNRRRRLMPSCPMDLTTVMTARSYPSERELIIRHPESLSPEAVKSNVATLRQEMYPTMLRGPSDKMVSIKEEGVEMVVEGFEGKKGELAWDRAVKVSKALGIELAVRPPKWLRSGNKGQYKGTRCTLRFCATSASVRAMIPEVEAGNTHRYETEGKVYDVCLYKREGDNAFYIDRLGFEVTEPRPTPDHENYPLFQDSRLHCKVCYLRGHEMKDCWWLVTCTGCKLRKDDLRFSLMIRVIHKENTRGGRGKKGREGGRGKKERSGNKEKEENNEVRIGYMNANGSSIHTHNALELAKSELDIVFIGEPMIWENKHTTNHPAFKRVSAIDKDTGVVCYIRIDWIQPATVSRDGCSSTTTIDNVRISGVYLPGDFNMDILQNQLDITSDIILGDFNAHHIAWGGSTNNRGNVVYDTFEEDFNQLIPANAITFRRGSIMSCLDLIFVRKGLQANIHTLSGSWLGSDHALITVTIQIHGMSSRVYTTPDWTKWNEYIDSNPKYVPAHHGDAYKHLCWLAERFCRTKEATPRSKKWWDKELATQLKKTRRAGRKGEGYEQARKDLHRLITKKKKICWDRFLEEHGHKDPWEVARIAKDPFKCSPLMGDIMTEDGRLLTTDQEKPGV
ncbi:hypothetical protein EV426DRAFT_662632 [Tirmania nivea]|nr:hypothetical protein EV426DRAFT_662632 [Tirmania nivea]